MQKDEGDSQEYSQEYVCVRANVYERERERKHKHTERTPWYSSYEVTHVTHLFFFTKRKKKIV